MQFVYQNKSDYANPKKSLENPIKAAAVLKLQGKFHNLLINQNRQLLTKLSTIITIL
ncbi:MAG: hypothetical protein LDL13_07245 [Calditerrivibrio sp.]|nr:hypothetical protein [Calditerrivibrio sp.]MCA1980579.1 hypothetical protein [Calditerrivibrio sp.]